MNEWASKYGALCQCPLGPCARTLEWDIDYEVDPDIYPTSGLRLNLHSFMDCQYKIRYFPCEAKAEPIDRLDLVKLNYTLFPRVDPEMINIVHGHLCNLWKNGSKFEALRVQDWYIDVLRAYDTQLKNNGAGTFRAIYTYKPSKIDSEAEFYAKMNLPYKSKNESEEL